MFFIDVKTKEYPISETDLRKKFLNISLPRYIKREDVLHLGYDVVVETDPVPPSNGIESYEIDFEQTDKGCKIVYRKKKYDGSIEDLRRKIKSKCTKVRKEAQNRHIIIDDIKIIPNDKNIQSLTSLIECFKDIDKNTITFKTYDLNYEIVWKEYKLKDLKALRKILIKHLQDLYHIEKSNYEIIDAISDVDELIGFEKSIHFNLSNSVYTIE